ncbi:IS1595 family transposase [Aggregatibacter segnis]|uniref:IS1595 family transposase n=1 Tax=Aggregatibacter segnis TaxID=739 RepID=UPI000D687615|nr:IS1595 family transposase [Aggregatibacter segnis]
MAQHFLLSARSRALSLKQLYRLSNDEAFNLIKTARWGNAEDMRDVICPHCGKRHHAFFLSSRKRWRCAQSDCGREFSVTSQTALAYHKLSFVDLLAAIYLFVNKVKGLSAIELSRALNINYKSAYALLHKLREVLFKTRDLTLMSGEIHEDGAWINFRLKPANFRNNRDKQREKKDKKGRRFLKFRPTKRCIINFSQCACNDEIMNGSSKTLVAMDYTENVALVTIMNQRFVKAGSCVMSDENPAYNNLKLHYEHYAVNHQEAYSKCGVNNNLAESFNARMRDLMRGTHHKTDNKYALHYANYAAYLSDNRRNSNRELFEDVLKRCLWVLPLKEWVGYWQGNHRQGELIGMKAFAPEEISQNYFKRLEEQMKCQSYK